MPKAVTTYYCNICERGYSKEEQAAACEKKHLLPVAVEKPVYDKRDTKAAYPESVLVSFRSSDPKETKQITARYYRKYP